MLVLVDTDEVDPDLVQLVDLRKRTLGTLRKIDAEQLALDHRPSAAVDKQEMTNRISKMENQLVDEMAHITELRLWRARTEGMGVSARP